MPAIYVDTENDRRKMNVTNKQLRRTHWQHNSIRVHGQGLIRIKLRDLIEVKEKKITNTLRVNLFGCHFRIHIISGLRQMTRVTVDEANSSY